MNGFVVNFSSLYLYSGQKTTLLASLNAIFGEIPNSEWVRQSTKFFFFLRKSTFEHKTIKSGHKMLVGVKKSAEDDFKVFRLSYKGVWDCFRPTPCMPEVENN